MISCSVFSLLLLLSSSAAYRVKSARLHVDRQHDERGSELARPSHQGHQGRTEGDCIEQVLNGEWDTDYHTIMDDWSKVHMTVRNDNFTHGKDKDRLHMSAASHVFKGNNGTNGARVITVVQVLPIHSGEPCAMLEQRFDMMSDIRHTGTLKFDKSKNDGKMYWIITWDHGRQWWRLPLVPEPKPTERCVCDGFAREGDGYKSIGGPQCDTTSSTVGGRWCYVKPGTCPDGKAPSDPEIAKNHEYSAQACKGLDGREAAGRQDQAKQAHADSAAMLKQWDNECRAKQKNVDVDSLEFTATVGLSLGTGILGPSVQADIVFNLDPRSVRDRANRLQCMITQLDKYSKSKTAKASDYTPMRSSIQRAAGILHEYTNALKSGKCGPGVSFLISFTIIPTPPFVWPIPVIGISFNWPLHFGDIERCHGGLDAAKALQEAYHVRSDDQNIERAGSDAKERMKADNDRQAALGFAARFDQGPVFMFFPLPAVGWSWNADVKLSMSLRRIVKGIRNTTDWLMHGSKSKCFRDRQEYFRQVTNWAEHSHDIASSGRSACEGVRDRLAVIRREHPDTDYERDPFSLVPQLEQLGGQRSQRADSRSIELGGGYFSITTLGISVGMYANVFDERAEFNYSHKCGAFEDFVNTYQRGVVPSFCDVVDNDCELGEELQPMNYQSCRAIDKNSSFGRLPQFPAEVIINRKGRVLEATESQCTSCLGTASYGMPCNYCSGEMMTGESCRQHSGSFVPCTSTKVSLNLDYFDRQSEAEGDVRLLCGLRGRHTSFVQVGDELRASEVRRRRRDSTASCRRRSGNEYTQCSGGKLMSIVHSGGRSGLQGLPDWIQELDR